MSDKCVVRNAQYRRGGLNKRERHNERKNTDYMNEDIIAERAGFNVHFKESTDSYEAMFDKLLSEGTISTRGLGKDPFIVDELVFDVNSAYFENLGGYDYAKQFFEEAYRCAVNEVGGEQYVLSAVMHADERNKALSEQLGRDAYHYHLHVVYVPVVQKEIYFKKNNKNPELAGKLKEVITQVSHSKKWPRFKDGERWVNSYSLLQDRFFEHMKAAGFEGFERGERGSTAEHLTVLEYKTQQETKRAEAITEQADKTEKQLGKLERRTAVAKQDAATFSEIDSAAKKTIGGNYQLSPAEWKKVSGLAKEGVKAKGKMSGLKKSLANSERKSAELEARLQHYKGMGITDTMRYYEAKQRAPQRLAEAVADIMAKPPENQERKWSKNIEEVLL